VEQIDQDVDLAVALVNTRAPSGAGPERLTEIAVYQRILRDRGQSDLAGQLAAADLSSLLALRADLIPIFAATGAEERVAVIDPLLRTARIAARLTNDQGAIRWNWGAEQKGLSALRTRLLAALASHLVCHGGTRLGVCQADPCRLVFVDRGRARTRRYCGDRCNDRAATAAYRQRRG